MDMVGHKNVGMNLTLVLLAGPMQETQIETIVVTIAKAGLAIVSSLNNVLRHTG